MQPRGAPHKNFWIHEEQHVIAPAARVPRCGSLKTGQLFLTALNRGWSSWAWSVSSLTCMCRQPF